jgi:nitrite reductase/ring-hydroxylating ferredoxin subunit
MTRTRLCALDDIPDGESTGLSIPDGDLWISLLLVRRDSQVFIYRNRCPHEGDRMEHGRGKFLDEEGKNILCASHGAVFRIEDGVCTEGPCEGESLIAFPAHIEEGSVFIDV